MILSYSVQGFPDKILEGIKKHTFREDEEARWKPGRNIEHWWRNPRNKHLGPYEIKKGTCCHVSDAVIMKHHSFQQLVICIDGLFYPAEQVAINDGFNSVEEMEQYFLPKTLQWGDGVFAWVGRCIFFEPKQIIYPDWLVCKLKTTGNYEVYPNYWSPYVILEEYPELGKAIDLTS